MGQPLQLTPTGGLMMADGNIQGQQQIVRRLLTNPGDLLADLTFGAGIPKMIGSVGNTDTIKGVIVNQMAKEPIVIQNPPPKIGVTSDPDTSVYQAVIVYQDNSTLEANQIRLPLSGIA